MSSASVLHLSREISGVSLVSDTHGGRAGASRSTLHSFALRLRAARRRGAALPKDTGRSAADSQDGMQALRGSAQRQRRVALNHALRRHSLAEQVHQRIQRDTGTSDPVNALNLRYIFLGHKRPEFHAPRRGYDLQLRPELSERLAQNCQALGHGSRGRFLALHLERSVAGEIGLAQNSRDSLVVQSRVYNSPPPW